MPAFGYREQTELPRFLRFLRNRKLAVLVGLVFVTFILTTFSNKGLLRRVMLERDLVEQREKIVQLRTDIRELREMRNSLANDQFMIERVARETHGMIKPGEVVYRIRPAKSQQSPSR